MLFLPADEATARDRWFVRARDYLGVGSCLSWDQPLVLPPGGTVIGAALTSIDQIRQHPTTWLASRST